LVTVVLAGDYGKPRPSLIVQDDAFGLLDSCTLLLLTSDGRESPLVRIPLHPTPENGLRLISHVMIDKAVTVPRARLGAYIGRAEAGVMAAVNTALARFLGVAGL
jgi:mRNA interferase MazF